MTILETAKEYNGSSIPKPHAVVSLITDPSDPAPILHAPIAGIPLYRWGVSRLRHMMGPDAIHVFSNDAAIVENLSRWGYDIRHVNEADEAAANIATLNHHADAILHLQPGMPFLRKATLRQALETALETGHPTRLSPTLHSAFAAANSHRLTLREHTVSDEPTPLYMDAIESIAITEEATLPLGRAVAEGLGFHSEHTCGLTDPPHGTTIKMLVLDVDGTMTDGGMYYAASGDEIKKFNAKDGMAIRRLRDRGLAVGFLSTGIAAAIVQKRAERLGVEHVHVGLSPKKEILAQWIAEAGINWPEVAFIGDDINDLSVADSVGIFACPADAVREVKKHSHIVLQQPGGQGCIREFIDTYLPSDSSIL